VGLGWEEPVAFKLAVEQLDTTQAALQLKVAIWEMVGRDAVEEGVEEDITVVGVVPWEVQVGEDPVIQPVECYRVNQMHDLVMDLSE
jgi:hypothetical protein